MDAFGIAVETIKVIQKAADSAHPRKIKSCTVGSKYWNLHSTVVSSGNRSYNLDRSKYRVLKSLLKWVLQIFLEIRTIVSLGSLVFNSIIFFSATKYCKY